MQEVCIEYETKHVHIFSSSNVAFHNEAPPKKKKSLCGDTVFSILE